MPTDVLLIEHLAYSKMFAYANIASKELQSEIGGFLIVDEMDEGGLCVKDILLPKQTVSGGSFKPEPGFKIENPKEVLPKIKGWWHSHGNMTCFHSGTDNDTLGDKWDGETKNSAPYALSIVVALPNEIKAFLQMFKPYHMEKVEVPVSILYPTPKEIFDQCAQDVKDRVKKETFQTYNLDYKEGRVWDNNLHKYVDPPTKTAEIRSELPDTRNPKGEAVEPITKTNGLGIDGEKVEYTDEDYEEEAKDYVYDPGTSLTVAELEAEGLYHPEGADKDLAEQVKLAAKQLRTWYESGGIIAPPPPHKEGNYHYGQCPHISYGIKGREICFFKGKQYDCSKCERKALMDKYPSAETLKEEAQPSS